MTGGAGYIGSHTCVELIDDGHEVFVIDNLCNGHIKAIESVQRISNKSIGFSKIDIRDKMALDRVFAEFAPEAVIHFAGLKSVGESVTNPLNYFSANVHGSLSLLEAMDRVNCSKIIFSSSATVYGDPNYLPYDESHPTHPVNPYGRSKLMVEQVLQDWVATGRDRRAIALRYFNPVGAHQSGSLGEISTNEPNNLMPYIAEVALGKRSVLNIFGNDYDTPDGTGIRDYLHVVDLATAHVKAVGLQMNLEPFEVINIGSGKGTSVLELVKAFELASGIQIQLNVTPRREGDLPAFWADAFQALEKLDWKTTFTISDMCRDTWAWQKHNPMVAVEGAG